MVKAWELGVVCEELTRLGQGPRYGTQARSGDWSVCHRIESDTSGWALHPDVQVECAMEGSCQVVGRSLCRHVQCVLAKA